MKRIVGYRVRFEDITGLELARIDVRLGRLAVLDKGLDWALDQAKRAASAIGQGTRITKLVRDIEEPIISADLEPRVLDVCHVRDLLALVTEPEIPTETIAAWSAEERAEADRWASLEYYAANDNPVTRVPMPVHVRFAIGRARVAAWKHPIGTDIEMGWENGTIAAHTTSDPFVSKEGDAVIKLNDMGGDHRLERLIVLEEREASAAHHATAGWSDT